MTGYHTRWVRPEAQADDPERIAIREALAFGKALYDRRTALGLSVADLAQRAGMSTDEIECIEEGGTEPTVALLRRLAAALDADVRLTAGHDLGSVWFRPTRPDQPRPGSSQRCWVVSGHGGAITVGFVPECVREKPQGAWSVCARCASVSGTWYSATCLVRYPMHRSASLDPASTPERRTWARTGPHAAADRPGRLCRVRHPRSAGLHRWRGRRSCCNPHPTPTARPPANRTSPVAGHQTWW